MPETSQVSGTHIDCHGGLVLDKNSQLLPDGAAVILQNYEPSINGGYRRISGFEQFDSNAVTGAGNILGISFLGSNAIACRGANVEYSSGSGWTSITTARTSAGRYHFDNYNWTGTEILVMASGDGGTNKAATWDGSTYFVLDGSIGTGTGTAPTNPLDVKEHKGHLFFLQGSTITFSAPFNANKFDPADGAGEVLVPDTGVAMVSFRETLYILCKKSIHKIIGSSIADFRLKPVTKNIGCLSGWSVQEIGGDIVFLAPDGLRTVSGTTKIDDIGLGTISKNIQSRIQNLDTTTYTVNSLVVRDKGQYRLWYSKSIVAETQNQGIMGVLLQGQQGLEWNYADMLGIKPSAAASGYLGNIEYFLHGGWDNGIIYKQESGDTFNSVAINARFRTKDFTFGDIGIRKRGQRIHLTLEFEGTVTPDLQVEYDYDSSDSPQPALISISVPAYIGIYGIAKYGQATYSSDPTAVIRNWMIGSGYVVAFTLNENDTNGPFTIQGFQIDVVPGGRR
jgi:hypothetical protein